MREVRGGDDDDLFYDAPLAPALTSSARIRRLAVASQVRIFSRQLGRDAAKPSVPRPLQSRRSFRDRADYSGVAATRDLRARSMITTAALLALGRGAELRVHMRGAVNLGITHTELNEMIFHLAQYSGVPKRGRGDPPSPRSPRRRNSSTFVFSARSVVKSIRKPSRVLRDEAMRYTPHDVFKKDKSVDSIGDFLGFF
jgi:alkylhydroperoxidase/carboxymuconolactone decarboxylase family protein YurZ